MNKKFFFLFVFLFAPFLFFRPQSLFSQNTNQPSVYFSHNNSQLGGLIEYSSIEEPKITLNSNGVNGSAKLEIYQASLDDLLQYLVHDSEYKQLYPQINSSKFTHLSDLNINITDQKKDISLPIGRTGVYFIRFAKGDLKREIYILRSSFGTIAREAKSSLVLWSQDFTTKKSLNGGKAILYNLEKQKKIIGTANLDSDAVASLPLSKDTDLAIVQNGEDFSLVPLNAQYLNAGWYWLSFDENRIAKRYLLFTDRPIYKPGDTVNFKAIIRDDDDARYSMPNGSVNVEVSQGWDSKIYLLKTTLNINSNGFIASSFTIPKNAKTGDYEINLSSNSSDNDLGGTIYFKVENYRKPEYTLNAKTSQFDIIRGDSINIDLDGQYYSGQPLANTDISYKVYSSDNSYYDSDYFYPENGNHYYGGWYGQEIDSGTVSLDAKGKSKFSLSTGNYNSNGKHQVFFIEFSYIDDTGNPANTGVSVLVRSGEYSLYRDGYGPYGSKPNEKISLPFILKANLLGKSLAQKVNIKITRHWWEAVFNNNQKYPTYNPKEESVGNYQIVADSSGKAVFDFTPQKAGSYYLDTEITDSRGNKINKTFYLWVNDEYNSYYDQDFNRQSSTLKIITDKKSYNPGDTALINLNSDIPDRDVFLSFERGYQDRYQIIRLNGKEKTIEAKITDHDLPNIYLTVRSFGSNNLDGYTQNIPINTDSKKAFFSISTDKQNYAPGDEVTATITAKDITGKPLETNFALWSVDKAIYALADKNYDDIINRFWGERFNDTSEANSLQGIGMNPAEKGGCFLSGTKVKMADGSEKSIESIKVGDKILTRLSDTSSRLVKTSVSAIHSTAASDYLIINKNLKVTGNHLLFINNIWRTADTIQLGDELIDSSGNQIKVTFIEYLSGKNQVYNLTTDKYHTYFADNIYVHNQKGGGARKNFADTAYWNASVNTGSDGRAQIKFKLPDNLTTWVITVLGASTDTKVGEAFSEIKVNKDLVIRPALPNILSENDTVNLTAMVHNFTDLSSQATVSLKTDAGQIVSPQSQNIDLLPNDFVSVSWQIKVSEAKTANLEFSVKDNLGRSDTIIQKIDIRSIGYWQQSSEFKVGSNTFLLSKPAQDFDKQKTTLNLSLSSSILGSLPTAMTYLINYPYGCTEQTTSGLLAKIISQKYPIIFADSLKKQLSANTIEKSIDKLASLQNSDGGWPWWWGDSNEFVTSYVYRLITQARQQGVKIDDYLFENAQKYLLNNFDNATLESKVNRAYGLSFSKDSSLHKTITQNLESLDNDHLAMAVATNITAGQTDSNQNGLNLLLSRAQNTSTGTYWSAGKIDRFGSVESSTALATQALIKANRLPEAAKAVNYLVKNRHFDYWASSYATAQTILAITDFSQLQQEEQTNLIYKISLDGKTIKIGKFTGIQTTPIDINLDSNQITDSSSLNINTQGSGEIYSTLTQKWWLKDSSALKASHGVTITKKIINHKGEEYNLVPGDLVDVVLNVTFDSNTPENNDYAIIEDHLPSGLIPINTRLKNEDNEGYYEDYSREYLTDGIIIPIYYNQHATSYTYQARVISSGSFNVPPAYYSLMYFPEIWSRSESAILGVDTLSTTSPIDQIKKAVKNNINSPKQIIISAAFIIAFVISSFLVIRYVKKKQIN